ncbi:MAG TPA: hypothetical protein VLX60_15705 [Terriglobales bacterium]|nr:hypothetical protein [Terriglobales bacterium]
MAGPGSVFKRAFFWTYERGSWQYDLAVVLIVIFVLLTPGKWFHDQPEVGAPASPSQVDLISDTNGQITYRVDARILAPPEQTPQLQSLLHGALQKSLPDLNHARFEILKIEPQRNDQGNVIAYQVTIRKK